MSSEVQVINADPLAVDDKMDRAQRINYFHDLSRQAGRVSIAAAIAAGIELERAAAEVEHGFFSAWIEAHCHFSRSTAYKYRAAAKAVLGDDLSSLLTTSDDIRRGAIENRCADLDSATLSELYIDAGIVRKAVSNMGGRRAGAGRKRKLTAEELAAQAAAAQADPDANMQEGQALVDALSDWAVGRNGFAALRKPDLNAIWDRLNSVLMSAYQLLDKKGRRK